MFTTQGHEIFSDRLTTLRAPAAQVRLIWGLQGMDTSGKALWDAADVGQLAFDSSFDPSSAQAQLFLLQACLCAILQPRVRLFDSVLLC